MPVWAASNRPVRLSMAPVNAPRTWPNSSLSSRLSLRAPQLTRTKGPLARGLRRWIAVAISSLPVPVSPSSSTEALERATCRVMRIDLFHGRARADDAGDRRAGFGGGVKRAEGRRHVRCSAVLRAAGGPSANH